jgi:hypothetical protein
MCEVQVVFYKKYIDHTFKHLLLWLINAEKLIHSHGGPLFAAGARVQGNGPVFPGYPEGQWCRVVGFKSDGRRSFGGHSGPQHA